MGDLWNTPGVPHRGWICVGVIDLRPDLQSESPDDFYQTCDMCGQEKIRYVHIMKHLDYDEQLQVGRVCAGKMGEDYAGARQRENRLKNLAKRRANWLKRKWRTSAKGNSYLNLNGRNIGVCPDHYRASKWRFFIDGIFSQGRYASEEEAKLALFDHVSEMDVQ